MESKALPTSEPQQLSLLRTIIRSRWLFVVLQVLDLVTTLAAFRMGAYEVNPLVAQLTQHFGRVGGVVISKVSAVLIALGVKRLVWVINIFYGVVVAWNCLLLIVYWLQPK